MFALTPLEAGLVFPEAADELEPDADVEEALPLIKAAFLAEKCTLRDGSASSHYTFIVNWNSSKAPCGPTHPDLDSGFPSVLQSWSNGWRCLRQKFKWHWSQVTRIISFCLQPPLEHLFVKIWKVEKKGGKISHSHHLLRLRKEIEKVVWTFLFLWAGSDLQSRSMCSPTLMSGISPLLMGIGVLHSGHTGTWIS